MEKKALTFEEMHAISEAIFWLCNQPECSLETTVFAQEKKGKQYKIRFQEIKI